MTFKTLKESLANRQRTKEQDERKNKQNTVTFGGGVEVRSHEIILGDNPSVSGGPPLTTSWENFNISECSIDKYEADRVRPSRDYNEMMIPAAVRFDILTKANTIKTINRRVKEVNVVKGQRIETRMYMYRAKNEERTERLVRGFINLVTSKKKKEREFMSRTAF